MDHGGTCRQPSPSILRADVMHVMTHGPWWDMQAAIPTRWPPAPRQSTCTIWRELPAGGVVESLETGEWRRHGSTSASITRPPRYAFDGRLVSRADHLWEAAVVECKLQRRADSGGPGGIRTAPRCAGPDWRLPSGATQRHEDFALCLSTAVSGYYLLAELVIHCIR